MFLNRKGAEIINMPVTNPEYICTLPINCAYAVGLGCNILNCVFHATWNKIVEMPCEIAITAKQDNSGEFATNFKASNKPLFFFERFLFAICALVGGAFSVIPRRS